jgi:hypothetical protein
MTHRRASRAILGAFGVLGVAFAFWGLWPLPWYRMIFVYICIEAAHGAVDIALHFKKRDEPVCSYCHAPCHKCQHNEFLQGLR